MTAAGHLVVLETFAEPGPETNPYLTQLLAALRQRTTVRVFSWRQALLGRYDVLHVHLPDRLARSGSRTRTWLTRLLLLALLVRCRVRRVAIVRTLHNLRPHEDRGFVERRLLDLVDRWTDWWIRINEVDELPAWSSTIVHGHYRDWFGPSSVAPEVGTFGIVGLLRRYKNVDHLVRTFADVDDPDLRLLVAGKVQDDRLEPTLRDLAARDTRVRLSLTYLGDDELARVVRACELVVLPYRELRNSGAALLALSLDRPVLLPRGEVTEALAHEVGEGWVATYDGDLTADDLVRSLAEVRARSTDHPNLSARGWDDAATAHLDAFDQAVRRRRGRP